MLLATTQLAPVSSTIALGFFRIYAPWAICYLLFLIIKPYTPLRAQETLFDWYLSTSVEGGAEALAEVRLNGSPPFLSYAWKPVLYILAHALMSLLGCAASGLFL